MRWTARPALKEGRRAQEKAREADSRLAEVDAIRREMERLETPGGPGARRMPAKALLHKVDESLTHEKAVRVAAYETDPEENCDNIARK